jgi:hypothetical protein
MHACISSPVATIGCETAKWKETDRRVLRPSLPQLFPTLKSSTEQALREARLALAVVADQDEVTDTAVYKPRTLSFEVLLAT